MRRQAPEPRARRRKQGGRSRGRDALRTNACVAARTAENTPPEAILQGYRGNWPARGEITMARFGSLLSRRVLLICRTRLPRSAEYRNHIGPLPVHPLSVQQRKGACKMQFD